MTIPDAHDPGRLAALIAQSLDLADTLGLDHVGVYLNDALVRLTGEGKTPASFAATA